ncbi:response regulator [Primorskyibacter sp. 2E107]|uniref:response regulator n=1 Tax=Primorskyibacter sp. 2E107 TaxID=3403458 RepID=UPI003AF6A234
MTEANGGDLATKVGRNLPFLRRYARALTGSQQRGDQYAMATLEAILSDPSSFDSSLAPKCALFKVFHSIWVTTGAPLSEDETGLASRAQDHLSRLTSGTREALLLHTIEELTFDEVAQIMDVPTSEVEQLVSIAYTEMAESVSGRVMIIEDEAIIAVDLEAITAEMGHKVTGVARTESAAVDLAARETPDLILSDIQLADNSSGIDAVNRILKDVPNTPVIFITAFPERLLTGEGPEPAFLISKPYTEDQVRSAISQAMFFSSTETLKV